SHELQNAFKDLSDSSKTQRGILISIKKEELVPVKIIPSTSPDFWEDINTLESYLSDDQAVYLILHRYTDDPDGFIAVTYVPDAAPVRSKMLFASTRLTLVRELGAERFRGTLFVTLKEELSVEGWKRHDKHGEGDAPLTEEEKSLKGISDATAEISRGTTSRSSHVSSGLVFPISESALQSLKQLPSGRHNLVQLVSFGASYFNMSLDLAQNVQKIEVASETIELAHSSAITTDALGRSISEIEPRYSFFRYSHNFKGEDQSPIIFIYTCPQTSRIKEKMLYASSRAGVLAMASSEGGIEVIEVSSPLELSAPTIDEELHPAQEQRPTFSRPKRPGKR
ncbi:Twinfilin-1, partial [Agyrium rufum]|nr:Twinfilin-1 [Agyrium rufum]